MIGWIILTLVVLFIAVVLIRTLRFTPKAGPALLENEETFDKDVAIESLRALVRCRTVSYEDPEKEDAVEFEKLVNLLPALYPNVAKVCPAARFPDRGLLFKWEGKNHDAPSVLMAHYDVVPAMEENWDFPAFEGILKDGVLHGRGTLDTKITLNGILFAADKLIGEGFVPENDVYFAFSGQEEIFGPGAVHIVDWFKKQGIVPAMVVDEGGAVVEGIFPGVKEPCALIGIAEKGAMNVEYHAVSAGGHASAPKPGSPLPALAAACVKIEKHPFKARTTRPAREMPDTLGRHSTFLYRMIFANLWCFGGVLDLICKKSGGELNALIRTTVAFTQSEGSAASNVIPPEASMVTNIRINPSDSVESVVDGLKKRIKDDRVTLTVPISSEPSPISVTDCAAYDKVARAVASTWKGSLVSPYLMIQCSDSRHYAGLSDRVYRFSAMDLTSAERATIHGNNERVR
ncbi:MAG: M20/M25/M40 family metallo-hydrolase, partial [Clostridia bacterium]|nr:M20/M25/M40 family metallo-hydrolase [Clostridia bacterium]